MLTGVGVWALVFLLSYYEDARKVRTGVYLLLAFGWLAFAGVAALTGHLAQLDDLAGAWVMLGIGGFLLLTVVAFAGFLVVSGITLLRTEGRRLSHWLAVGVGVGLLGYVAGCTAVVAWGSSRVVVAWVLLGLPIAWFAFGFAAFLIYGALYPAIAARQGALPETVIVLGSGLVRGEVPPLLAARLDVGKAIYDRAREQGYQCRLLTSGGQGADEPVAEASAMADYLIARGVPPRHVLTETRSRNTEQNLLYSSELLRADGADGPVVVVTNNFHALRAAVLMRKADIPGHAVGAPTARHYWSSAVIREFLAVLRDNLWANVAAATLTLLPAVLVLSGWLPRF